MSLPQGAPVFPDVADPSDVLDWYLVVSRGDGDECILRSDEDIADFQLAPGAAAVAAGLQILTGARQPVREGLVIGYWTTIASASRSLAIYDAPGTELPIELTIVTTAGLSRTKQMTIGQLTRQG